MMHEIQLNGRCRQIKTGSSILSVIESLALNSKSVVVELNEAIVMREAFHQTILQPKDKLEILHFVGGG